MLKIVIIATIIRTILLGSTPGGIKLSRDSDPHLQLFPQIVSCGDGSCIIAWEDNENENGQVIKYGIKAQKINSNGQPLWASDIIITPEFTEGHITSMAMCEDGDGGAYIAFTNWQNISTSIPIGIYLQHLDSDGTIWQ